MKCHSLNLLRTNCLPIFKQLQIEEALLRADEGNWCLINIGSPPAIVMGISGKVDEHVNIERMEKKAIPIIRRFSGGGTVVVDGNTHFITLICNSEEIKVPCFPDHVHQWVEPLYKAALHEANLEGVAFCLDENDYVIGRRKFGGNAQYMRKGRWLHHTSLLWDYDPDHMDYLLMPPRMPVYRQGRQHSEFLCRLKDFIPTYDIYVDGLIGGLQERFEVRTVGLGDVEAIVERPHRKATSEVKIKA